jgi:hypothetical protein
VAKGDSAEAMMRRHQRLPIELPVLWQVPGALQDNAGILRDIGRGGAFVKTEQSLPDHTDVVLKVSPPGAEVAMPLQARVAWKGHPGGEHGFGVEWKARDAGGTRRIKELVRRIEAMGEGFYGRAASAG